LRLENVRRSALKVQLDRALKADFITKIQNLQILVLAITLIKNFFRIYKNGTRFAKKFTNLKAKS